MKSVIFILLLFFCPPAQAQITLKSARAPDLFTLAYPKSTPTATFFNEYGQDVGISNFRGKIILLNIWSTGCSQCVIELPMLDRLQKEMGGMKFQVVALSTGLETIPALRRFFVSRGVRNLRVYSDPQAKYSQAAGVLGLPTTFLINEDGMEIGRVRGIVDWTNPKLKAQIRGLIAQGKAKREREKSDSEKENDPPPPAPEPKPDFQGWFKK
ncbi:MAG TPA: redoxin [Alphaproteobacteria bacterium]|nr:redoxin [Alphaproteobacteria bacterium]